jgi:four helix bundle protein
MRDYRKIKAWQLADSLVIGVYKATQNFPKEERYGLISQLRRAAVSVPTNIVEGAGRQHKKDYLNFLYTARGSLSEVEYLLGLSERLNFITTENLESINNECNKVQSTLYGLIKSVEDEI